MVVLKCSEFSQYSRKREYSKNGYGYIFGILKSFQWDPREQNDSAEYTDQSMCSKDDLFDDLKALANIEDIFHDWEANSILPPNIPDPPASFVAEAGVSSSHQVQVRSYAGNNLQTTIQMIMTGGHLSLLKKQNRKKQKM